MLNVFIRDVMGEYLSAKCSKFHLRANLLHLTAHFLIDDTVRIIMDLQSTEDLDDISVYRVACVLRVCQLNASFSNSGGALRCVLQAAVFATYSGFYSAYL